MKARKLTFDEIWHSTTVFFVDDLLEQELDEKVANLLTLAADPRLLQEDASQLLPQVARYLHDNSAGLDILLKDIQLSEEKFMRIVSLLRKIGRVAGDFDSEWKITKIKQELTHNHDFALEIARLLLDGKRDATLRPYIPKYYLDKLNYREIRLLPHPAKALMYKDALIGTYGARKGHRVEALIAETLEEINRKHGIGYEKGRSRFINVDIDFAIPTLDNPQLIIMSSFQETTSSGQTTKARDMLSAYTRIVESNSRYGENRAFINFVDGGGWLARKRDLERLAEQCHYFLNLQHLPMLEAIVLRHMP